MKRIHNRTVLLVFCLTLSIRCTDASAETQNSAIIDKTIVMNDDDVAAKFFIVLLLICFSAIIKLICNWCKSNIFAQAAPANPHPQRHLWPNNQSQASIGSGYRPAPDSTLGLT